MEVARRPAAGWPGRRGRPARPDGDTRPDRAEELLERAEGLAGSQADEALDLIDEADPRVLRARDPALAARAHYLRARILNQRGAYAEAFSAIRAARLDYLAAGHALEAMRTSLGQASVHHELGEYRAAATVTERLLEELSALPAALAESRVGLSIRARAHSNRANSRIRLGDPGAASLDFDIALNLFEALEERDKVAETRANRGGAYLELGMTHFALDHLEQAEHELRVLGLELAAAKCSVDVAEALVQLGRAGEAVAVLERAEVTFERFHAVPALARSGLTMARALLAAGLIGDSHDEALEAADICTELAMIAESGQATHQAGLASLEAGDLERAASELDVAARLLADCGDEGGLAHVRYSQARLARGRGEETVVRRLARESLESCRALGMRIGQTRALLVLALHAETTDEAAQLLSEAKSLISTMDLEELRVQREVVEAHLLRRRGRRDEAVDVLRAAVRGNWQRLCAPGQSRLDLPCSAGVVASEQLVQLLVEVGTRTAVVEAWQVATLAKSFVVNHLASPGSGGAGSALASMPATLASLSASYDEVTVLADPFERRAAIARCRDKERELARLTLAADAEHPCAVPVPQPPAVPELTAVQYHVVEPDLLVFVLSDGQVDVRRIRDGHGRSVELTERWQALCARWGATPRGPGRAADVSPECAQVLAELEALLLAPVADLLVDFEDQPLLVIPHRHLHAVPFEALPRAGVPLAARHRLHFCAGLATPSEPAPRSERESVGEPAGSGVLVLGAPDARAPGIEGEAHEVAAVHGGAELLLGHGATVDRFWRETPGRDVVHLAAHGEYGGTNPWFSRVRLGDRWLLALELMHLDLRGALVVVSSCHAGRSADSTSGPVGLAWALLAAGARGVVVTEWAVDDEVAADFMVRLHRELRAGLGPRDAVALAQQQVAETRPHPYHWAAFRYVCSAAAALVDGAPG